ncbi:hypothetical protein ATG70_2933 [Bacillus sp. es.036]|nr:hypothetical protein ATG70_2933 [Bacillus sp. es.036]
MATEIGAAVPDKLEEWISFEDQKRLREKVSVDQDYLPEHTTHTWALLGTPLIEPSRC